MGTAALGALMVFVAGTAEAQHCVAFARQLSTVDLRGDAWMWWDAAAGRYARGQRPAAGAVLVFPRDRGLPYGHVSTVSRVDGPRLIRVDHSWLRGRGLYRGMRVEDVSRGNDWTRVRVWHPPSNDYGTTVYRTHGFVLPWAPGREPRLSPGRGPQIVTASAGRAGPTVAAPVAGLPPRKPPVPGPALRPAETSIAAVAPAPFAPAPFAPARASPAAVLPPGKPGGATRIVDPTLVAAVLPPRKPVPEWSGDDRDLVLLAAMVTGPAAPPERLPPE